MARLLFRLFTAAAILSLVLCAAAVVMWVRSGRGGEVWSVYVRRAGGRYKAHSAGGLITLWGPPPAPPATGPAAAAANSLASSAATGIRNDQIVWQVLSTVWGWVDLHFIGKAATPFDDLGPAGPVGRTSMEIPSKPPSAATASAARPLLAALEDPDRFLAAHLALTHTFGEPAGFQSVAVDELPSGELARTINGLRVVLRRERRLNATVWVCSARADPAQLPAIRDQWHRRLDVPAVSLPYWQLVAATLVLPVARLSGPRAFRWLWKRSVARSRGRRGLCLACAYALTGNLSGVCPECGTKVTRPGRQGAGPPLTQACETI